MEDRLGVIGYVHGRYASYTNGNEEQLRLCLVKAFPSHEFEYREAPAPFENAEYTVIDLPDSAWVIIHVLSKPAEWTWAHLIDVVRETKMLPFKGQAPIVVNK